MADDLTSISGILSLVEIQDDLDIEDYHLVNNFNQLITHHNDTVTQFNALNANVAANKTLIGIETAARVVADTAILKSVTDVIEISVDDTAMSWAEAAADRLFRVTADALVLPDFTAPDDLAAFANGVHPLTFVNCNTTGPVIITIASGNVWGNGFNNTYRVTLSLGDAVTIYPAVDDGTDPKWYIIGGNGWDLSAP